MDTYVASALEMALRAEQVASAFTHLNFPPTDLQALTGEVVEMLQPLAQACGLKLLRDGSRCKAVCHVDPAALYVVLSHLILRALVMEPEPGHVRIVVDASSREARVMILSRQPPIAAHDEVSGPERELSAAQSVLQSMAGALVLEPRRGGYSPLCVALRNNPPVQSPNAAQGPRQTEVHHA